MFELTVVGRWLIQIALISAIGSINFLSLFWIRKEVTTIKKEVVEYMDYVKTQTSSNNLFILSPYELSSTSEPVTIPLSLGK